MIGFIEFKNTEGQIHKKIKRKILHEKRVIKITVKGCRLDLYEILFVLN